jgi:hypothetical protein
MKRKTKFSALLGAAALVGALVALPAASAQAAFDQSLGGGNCGAQTGFLRSNAKGSNVLHSVNGSSVALFNNGNTYITRTTSHARTWSSSHVHGSEGNGEWVSALAWANTGCGGL